MTTADPDIDRMTDAELKVVREHLGLTTRWLAEHLQVAERTVHRWEMGVSSIPDGVRVTMERLEQVTAGLVGAAVDACNDARDPTMITYRTDGDYRAHYPEQSWPASWHRALVARVAHEVPGLAIEYWAPRGR
jgi:DNA-binding XRE family transcriptional regulator